ncbi:MAG: hypothetical protein CSB46_07645, partial [Micrococcales bacterium]
MVDQVTGLPRVMVQLTQAAFLLRLFAVLMVMISSLGQPLTVPVMTGFIAAAGTSYLGLSRVDLLHKVQARPSLAMVDVVIIAGVTVAGGLDSPFVLALLTTALVLGLWVELFPGTLVIISLIGLYLLALTAGEAEGFSGIDNLVIPFVYLVLWYLGLIIRRAIAAETRSQSLMQDALTSAAAAAERTTLARTLHDSVAKTVQGIVLTSSTIGTYVERDPGR